MLPNEDVVEKVKTCLVQALGVKPEEVVPEATLVDDLGAESIDFVDIVFRLEKSFNIKIPRGELFPQDLLRNPQFVNAGRLTQDGVEELRKRLDFSSRPEIAGGMEVERVLSSLFTVRFIAEYVAFKLRTAAVAENLARTSS